MKGLVADIRHALRVYARTPVASGLAVVVLAVAMAFVGSFLSLYIDIVFQPHPGFEDSGGLVTIGQNNGRNISSMPYVLLERIDDEVASVATISGFMTTNQQVGPDREQRVVEFVSDRFFGGLRPRLELGRGFESADHDPDAEPVAVISYRYWQEQYGGAPDTVGRLLEIRGRPQFNINPPGQDPAPAEEVTTEFRIVGVMGRDLPSLQAGDTAAWIAYEIGVPLYFGPWDNVRNFNMLRALGRLADGASPAAVAAEIDERYQEADDLNIAPDQPFDAMSGFVLDINAQRNATRQLTLFLAGSVLVALVAAANVSLFLLSRAPGRRRELGIRMAVGAPLRRLARQLSTEASLLVLLATALGLLAGFWLQSYLQGMPFLQGARWQSASLFDWRVIAVIFTFLLLLTLLVSLAPVLGLKRLGIASSSRQVATRANLTQRAACTAQIAIAGTVASAAVAFGWYLGLLITDDHGFETRDIHAVTLSQGPAANNPGNANDFAGALVRRERRREIIEAIPGVEAVAFSTAAPGVNTGILTARIPRPVPPGDTIQFTGMGADRQFFEILGLDILHGRLYEGDEGDVMIVNEAAAQLIWGRTDVVGESLPISISDADSSEMIGVVANISHEHPDTEVPPRIYIPILPFFGGAEAILIRSPMSSADLRTELQSLIDAGELEMTIRDVQSLGDRVSILIAADRARSLLTISSAALVLVLAGFGFYGTQRYLVAAGRREYAIRASIGAGPRALGRLVMSRGLVLSLPGVVLGGLLAFIVSAWLRDDFVSREISPGVVTMAVVAALAGLLLAASLGPARQARRTEPAPLLREE
jgi:predicted permease